jgi:hypothetical protein
MISEDNNDHIETHKTSYFGCDIVVWKIKGPYWRDYPWRFAITHEGSERRYGGSPNFMETKAQALKRAWYRAKWLSTGEYGQKYV